jgi:quinol-cytochrome oxidoreductase complex cytochrome b subunit
MNRLRPRQPRDPARRRQPRDPARRWHLTPWGWILTVAAPVLAIVAVVDPTRGVILALIAVIVVWAVLLAVSFPSTRAMNNRLDRGRDYGRDAAEEWERGHGPRD